MFAVDVCVGRGIEVVLGNNQLAKGRFVLRNGKLRIEFEDPHRLVRATKTTDPKDANERQS